MTGKTTVTPILSSKTGYVSDIRDQVQSVLKFIILNPGWTSSIWEDRLVSFRKLASKYEHSRNRLAGELQSGLLQVFGNMFDQYSFDIQITPSDLVSGVKDGRYKLDFKILFQRGDGASLETGVTKQSALISGGITVDKTTNEIILKYDLNEDTATLEDFEYVSTTRS